MEKRFIEDSFPVKEVSENSAKEKNIRHGHISTLHVWWARRPLSSSRATNYAALIPKAKDENDWIKKRNFIIELSKWGNSLDMNLMENARKDILNAYGGNPPKVLNPFSGGGSIPLEALRLGCETYANDYNPVAVLIEKCILEYPEIYGHHENQNWVDQNPLLDELNKYSQLILQNTKKDVENFYKIDEKDSIPITYIWARTITCQNPTCNVEIPLMRQFWLSKKKNKKIALKLILKENKIDFEIIGPETEIPSSYDPSKGTINKAIVTCPICNSSIDPKTTRKLFIENKSQDRLIAVVFKHINKQGKHYRVANNNDFDIFNKTKVAFKQKEILFK